METLLEQTLESKFSGRAEQDPEDAVVLIIEDDHSLADLYEAFLEGTYDVRKATSGEAALTLLDEHVDIVLLDRRLGKWSGDELLTVIQEREIDCQVAMMTALRPDFDIIEFPIDDYLTKPISRRELLEAVDELLLRRRCTMNHRELLALVSRRIVLEQEKSAADLQANEQFAKLEQRIKVAKDHLGVQPDRITVSANGPSKCPTCGLRWDGQVGDEIDVLQLASQVWKCTNCGNVASRPLRTDRSISRI